MKKVLSDLPILKIIHIDKNIDLVNSMNPNPDFYGWRFYDFTEHQISESFNSSLYAQKMLKENKVIWRKMSSVRYNVPICGKDHSINSHFPPLTNEEML